MYRTFAVLVSLVLFAAAAPSRADEASDGEEPTYQLRYQLDEGERLYFRVVHQGKTNTRIKGKDQLTEVHSVSTKAWRVTDVNDAGEMTFDHVIESVEMVQRVGTGPELRWNSETDGEKTPPQFSQIASTLGEPLATVRINARGQVKHRDTHAGTEGNLGMGDLVLPLPDEAIAIGAQWSVPRVVHARLTGGEVKQVKVRELYTLEKVRTGVATISVRSQPLTPIDDEQVKSQVVQQLSNGEIRFDIDAGRMLAKRLDWDETVVGFQGAESMLEYRARLTEEAIDGPERRTAERKQPKY